MTFTGVQKKIMIKNLQEFENSFKNLTLPEWYTSNNEPKSLAGRNKGLFVVLDAHTDLLAPTSLSSDYVSFTGANFINVLRAAFTRADPTVAKDNDDLTVFFYAFEICTCKSSS